MQCTISCFWLYINFILLDCWVLTFGCFIGFDRLVTVFAAILTYSKRFGVSTVHSSWVIIFDYVTGFNKLELVIKCLTETDLLWLLFAFFFSFWYFLNFFIFVFVVLIHIISIIYYINLVTIFCCFLSF